MIGLPPRSFEDMFDERYWLRLGRTLTARGRGVNVTLDNLSLITNAL
jgi:hypothetical protein